MRTRSGLIIVVLTVCLVPSVAAAQAAPPAQTPAPTAPATPPPAVPVDYLFPSGAGLLIFHVRPAKVADFEAILARLKEALSKAGTPSRKQQAAHWNIYKSTEKPVDAVVYLFAFDPAITTASYDPLLLLAEALPAEVQPLYERLKDAVIRIERMGLSKIR